MVSSSSFSERLAPAVVLRRDCRAEFEREASAGTQPENPAVIRETGDSDSTWGGETCLDSRYILQITPMGFADSCSVGCERERSQG